MRSLGWPVVLGVWCGLILIGCKTPSTNSGLRAAEADQSSSLSNNADMIAKCKVLEERYAKHLAMTSGQTYLRFMHDQVKPMLDDVATNGYDLTDGSGVEAAYNCSVDKVKAKVDKTGLDAMKRGIEKIAVRHVTMTNLGQAITAAGTGLDAFDASNFFGFASGGGVMIKYDDANYSLNVHYDVKNMQSGRSYGIGPQKGANDASDKEFLNELEGYARASVGNLQAFFSVVLGALINSDTRGYAQVNEIGQGVLSDFLAIYTAEEDRNLMQTGAIKPYWDAALLEVTLLAGFHAGQSRFGLYYFDLHSNTDSYTTQTFLQQNCKLSAQTKPASLNDYWQFSRQWRSFEATDLSPAAKTARKSCTRSGINLTKADFRKLGQQISKWMRANQPEVFQSVVAAMGIPAERVTDDLNLYFELSTLLMSQRGLDPFPNADAFSAAWVEFVSQSTAHADDISASLQPASSPAATATPDQGDGHPPGTQPAGG